jgi:hypothetical protein
MALFSSIGTVVQEEKKMKTKISPIVIVLMFVGALISSDSRSVKGQTAPKDKRIRLSKYGVVLSIPSANNKGKRDLRHEGYAIAYRVKNHRTGEEEDRLAYAFGPQKVRNLKPVNQENSRTVVRTQDGALEITSEAVWDHSLNELRTWRSVNITATTEVVVLAIENHADVVPSANDRAKAAVTIRANQAALVTGRESINPDPDDCYCDPCTPNRPCRLSSEPTSGAYRSSLNIAETVRKTPVLIADSVGTPSNMSKGSFINILSWVRGVNMPPDSITPGNGLNFVVSFRLEQPYRQNSARVQ